MSKFEKLLTKMLACPADFTYMELRTILKYMGYKEIEGVGSRVCFKKDVHKIKLHKPHPGKILKRYQIRLIIDELKKEGLL
ncbi:MAG: type II toxin-antitoxin system HicA family toxin [Bacteroidales bacterium]|nr:type II toxin-antitoxin system HicA family toxin [Bacteroidales bacterium]